MTTIALDVELARDLMETKIALLDQEISAILEKWKVASVDEFVSGVRSGSFEEAEDDAIEVQNLYDKRQEISTLLESL